MCYVDEEGEESKKEESLPTTRNNTGRTTSHPELVRRGKMCFLEPLISIYVFEENSKAYCVSKQNKTQVQL